MPPAKSFPGTGVPCTLRRVTVGARRGIDHVGAVAARCRSEMGRVENAAGVGMVRVTNCSGKVKVCAGTVFSMAGIVRR